MLTEAESSGLTVRSLLYAISKTGGGDNPLLGTHTVVVPEGTAEVSRACAKAKRRLRAAQRAKTRARTAGARRKRAAQVKKARRAMRRACG